MNRFAGSSNDAILMPERFNVPVRRNLRWFVGYTRVGADEATRIGCD